MSASQKLTKKQKKSIAFRERRTKGKNLSMKDLEENGVPVSDLQDDDVHVEDEITEGLPEAEINIGTKDSLQSKKRKREEGGEIAGGTKKKKKIEPSQGGTDKPKKTSTNEKQRFILFVGNLKYTTSIDQVTAHFTTPDHTPSVRLLTPKKSSDRATTKSKGCAFVEFTHASALQQALRLHHSQLDGRTINVELTAGGGGKGENRLAKLKDRNKGLQSQRAKSHKETESSSSTKTIQRFSGTSGAEKAPERKRTWTVGDTAEEGKVHRGGKRHSKVEKKRQKALGSGMNAIPLGKS